MPRAPISYDSGEPIQTGDAITWAEHPGRVVWVRDSLDPDPAYPAEHWDDQDGDFLIDVAAIGLVLLDCAEPNEDLILIHPRSPCGTS